MFTSTDIIVIVVSLLTLIIPRLFWQADVRKYAINGYITIGCLFALSTLGAILCYLVNHQITSMVIFSRIFSIGGISHLIFAATSLEIFRRVEIKRAVLRVLHRVQEGEEEKDE